MAVVEEGFQGFFELNRSLKDQLETAKAQEEVAEELKQIFEAKLEKIAKKHTMLRKDLCLVKNHSTSLETIEEKEKEASP